MATVPLSSIQTLQAELRAWQETARRERARADGFWAALDEIAHHGDDRHGQHEPALPDHVSAHVVDNLP